MTRAQARKMMQALLRRIAAGVATTRDHEKFEQCFSFLEATS